jgi:hypothetical protein
MPAGLPGGAFLMTATNAEIARIFLETSGFRMLEQQWPRLRESIEPLTDAEVWWRPNKASNSIGNLILHLNGNVFQWLVAPFRKLKDSRNRPAEFAAQGAIPASALLERLGATMQQAEEVLRDLTAADLIANYEIQGYKVNGLQAVFQVVDHFAMHYGQILYIAKTLRGVDLGFYRELGKTGRIS